MINKNQLSINNKKDVILIIDDKISNIKVIVKYLKQHNFETIIAKNGKTGIERAKFSQPDLILLDVLMPGMDGFETCQGLKADDKTKDIPILFMTVLTETSDKVKAFQAGAVDFVSKPIQEEEILARVKTHIKMRKLQKSMEIKNEILQSQSMLLDQIKDSIISTDLNGRIKYVNQSAAQTLMRDQQELVGKTIHFLGENTKNGASQNEILEKTLLDGSWQGRVVNIDKNGSEHIIETRTWITYDQKGNKTGLVGVSTDITDQARMQDDLMKAKEAAEAANKAKTSFLSNISHELKSPLNTIIGYSLLMARDQKLSWKYRKDLKAIYNSGKHLLTLINELLEISSFESDNLTINNRICNIYKLINEVKGMFRLKAEEKGLQLIFDVSKDIPEFIIVDENKVRQVLINLFDNAFKFTTRGSITCNLSVIDHNDKILNEEKKQIIYFEIIDTGEGMPSDQLNDIFNPFVQLNAGRKLHKGTGLGLSICKKFVYLMGGYIGVKSEINCGSLFWFKINVKIPCSFELNKKQSERLIVSLNNHQNEYRMIIADNNEENRFMINRLILPLGFLLREAKNGMETLDIWKSWKPNLIMMDSQMPVMDGIETVKKIRELEAQNQDFKTIIIMLKDKDKDKDIKIDFNEISELFDDVLYSPLTESQVFEIIHKFIDIRDLYNENVEISDRNINSEKIINLPDNLKTDLKKASLNIDLKRIYSIIDEIRKHDIEISDLLENYAYNFEYKKILEILEYNF